MENKKDELKKLVGEVMEELSTKAVEEKAPEVEVKADMDMDAMVDKLAAAIVENKGGDSTEAKEIKETLITPDMGVFPELKDLKTLSDEETIVTFWKALVQKDRSEEANQVFKALVESDTGDGGYLVPAPLATEIWRILPDVSVMRRIARTMPMTSLTLSLNGLEARPTAYWTNEYASKTTTSAEFDQTTLTAYKLVALLPASHELIADANIDLVRFIIELFAEEIGLKEDAAFFTGSGVGQPTGISTETISEQSAGASLDFDDIIDLIHLTPSSIRKAPGAAFVCHQQVIKLLRKIKDDDGGYIWRDGGGRIEGQTRAFPDRVYSYPIYEQNDLSQDELYFGDWKFYIIGDRQQITVSTTNEGGDAWRRDSTEIKAVERVGGVTVKVGAFAKLVNV